MGAIASLSRISLASRASAATVAVSLCTISLPSHAASAPKKSDAVQSDASIELQGDDDAASASVDTSIDTPSESASATLPFRPRSGLSAQKSLSGAQGVEWSHYVANDWSLSASLGFATFSHRESNDDGEFKKVKTVGRMAAGLGAMHWPLRLQGNRARDLYADLGLGTRVLVYWGFTGDDEDDDTTLDTPLELDFEFPLAFRLFVGPQIHITPELGLVIRYIPGSREPDENNDTDANPGSGAGAGERLGTTNGPGLGFEWGDHSGMFVGLSIGYFFAPRKKK